MLVLSRKPKERILIGEDIVVTVCYYRDDGGVVIGIDAPRDVRVLRAELATEDHRRIDEDLSRERTELGKALAEIDRLRAELAQARGAVKATGRLVGALIETHPGAETTRPVALLMDGDGDVHAYEDMRDYHAAPQPRRSWGYTVRLWTWHPKSS